MAILHYDTGGGTWENKSGWLGNGNHCEWYGIKCNTDGLILEIDLRTNNLIGALPDLNLPALRYLYLENNALSNIPNFQYITSLRWLKLANNNVSTIPDFRNLTALQVMYLGNNPLTSFPQSLCDRVISGGLTIYDSGEIGCLYPDTITSDQLEVRI